MVKLADIPLERRVTVAVALIFLVMVGSWLAKFTTREFLSPDAYDYAQMGRENAQMGRGNCAREWAWRRKRFCRGMSRI